MKQINLMNLLRLQNGVVRKQIDPILMDELNLNHFLFQNICLLFNPSGKRIHGGVDMGPDPGV